MTTGVARRRHARSTTRTTHGPFKPHESPWTMTVPLVVLAILSTFGGLVGVPYAFSSMVGLERHKRLRAHARARHPARRRSGARCVRKPRTAHPPPRRRESRGELARRRRRPRQSPSAKAHSASRHAERAHSPEEVEQERLFTGISVLIALAGIGVGWCMFRKRPLREMPRLLENKYYVDEVYNAALDQPHQGGFARRACGNSSMWA